MKQVFTYDVTHNTWQNQPEPRTELSWTFCSPLPTSSSEEITTGSGKYGCATTSPVSLEVASLYMEKVQKSYPPTKCYRK